jgi:hypothetical protein
MSHASLDSSPNPKLALSMKLHIGDNVQIKFGGMGDTLSHTLSRLKKKKNLHVHVVLKFWLT